MTHVNKIDHLETMKTILSTNLPDLHVDNIIDDIKDNIYWIEVKVQEIESWLQSQKAGAVNFKLSTLVLISSAIITQVFQF